MKTFLAFSFTGWININILMKNYSKQAHNQKCFSVGEVLWSILSKAKEKKAPQG